MPSPAKALTLKKTAALEQSQVSGSIRELRRSIGLTQKQFATVLGVTYTTVNRWENGRMQPSPLAVKQIQAMLDQIIGCSALAEQPKCCQQLLEQYFLGKW